MGFRLTNKKKGHSSSTVKVRINNISGESLECAQVATNAKVRASYDSQKMQLDVGQVVLLEYRKRNGEYGYIVVDDLAEIVESKVLEAQHIISEGLMYTSLIVENPKTKQRIHSLIPNTNKLFSSSTSTIIRGDIVRIKINNGNIFSIHNCSEESSKEIKD